ncbi:MAG TPA: DUF2062 domain-containing protein [Nannocystaceae bacterium]|nr:DUF2062 domain-containing protein [Nannocystaceae bacterium]
MIRQRLRSLLTMDGTPRGIAGGFALGLSLSLVPIPFAGMVLALALAPFLRCNLPATYVGTAVVNPFTGAFFYAAELWIGMRLVGLAPPRFAELRALDASGWWALFQEMIVPFAIGATTLVIVALAIVFPLVYLLVARVRRSS